MPYAPGVQDISGQLLAQGMMQRAQGFAQGFTNFIGGIEQNKRMTNQALANFQGAVSANPNLLQFLESASNQEDPNAPKINPEIIKAFSEVKQGKTDVWNTALLANFSDTFNKAAAESQMAQYRQAQMQNLKSEMDERALRGEKTRVETELLKNPVRKPVYTREQLEQLYPNAKWDTRVTPTQDPNLVTLESANARAPETPKTQTVDVGNKTLLVDQTGRVIQEYAKGSPIPSGYEQVPQTAPAVRQVPVSLPQFMSRGSMIPGAESAPETAPVPSMGAMPQPAQTGPALADTGMQLRAIPGGPASIEQIKEAQKQVEAEQRQLKSAENIKFAINTIRENRGKTKFGVEPIGMFSGSRRMVNQAAVDIDEAVKTIEANIGFSELRDLKNSGTTLGQVAVKELENLQKLPVSLSRDQSDAAFFKNLDRIETEIDKSVNRLQILNRDFKNGLTAPSPAYFKAGGLTPTQTVKLGWSAGGEPGAGKLAQPAESKPRFSNPADQQAYEWAKNNPSDKRSGLILQKLGISR